MNAKAKGEKGERIVIGELAKFDIDVALPMTDNLPFDFIICYKDQLIKAQVKSSTTLSTRCFGAIEFNLRSNNWYNKTSKTYDKSDCDVMILCNYNNVYLLSASDFVGRSSFTIRCESAKNGQVKNLNLHDDYVLSSDRIIKVFEGR